MSRAVAAFVLFALGVAAVACGESAQPAADAGPSGGASRAYAMGLSSLPSELTDKAYAEAFALAGSAGEVVLIKRVPPWGALLDEDAFPSDEIVSTTRRETDLAKESGLELFVAIDPTGGAVAGELAELPAELRGVGFNDERIRNAFLRYVRYLALNYKPLFMALGVEVNSYEREDPEDFEHFLSLYNEAYDEVKALSSDTVVFPTFQLEELHGLLPPGDPRPPQWNLIGRFAPRIDLIALSTYPGLVFSDPTRLPLEYIGRARDYADVPVAIAEMGFSSETTASGADGEPPQAAFLARMLGDAERFGMPLVVWFAGQDPNFTGGQGFDLLQHLGLLRSDSSEKPAWSVWEEAAQRPLAPSEPNDR